MFCPSRLARRAILALPLLLASAAATPAVWVAGNKHTFVVDPILGRVVTLALDAPLAIAPIDGDTAWLVYENRAEQRTTANLLKVSVPTSQLTLGNAELAAYDTAGKTLWVADANGGKQIARTNAQGQLLKAWALPGNARAVAAGLDDSVWVLGNKRLWHYRADSTLLNDIDLQGLGGGEPKMLAVDSLGAWLWFDGERQLVRLDSHNPASSPGRITLPGTADYTTLDARTGELWIAVQSTLLAYDAGGRQTAAIDLAVRGIKKFDGLIFDPVSRSPWILHDKSLRRVDAQAQRDQVFALGEPLSTLGAAGFELVTQASIASPAQGALTNQALAPVSIQFDAACNGGPCGFAPTFFGEYRVAV